MDAIAGPNKSHESAECAGGNFATTDTTRQVRFILNVDELYGNTIGSILESVYIAYDIVGPRRQRG